MKKIIVIIVLSLLLVASGASALGVFRSDGNITVTGVTFGATTVDLIILNNSDAASISFNSGAFTVTDPGAFKVSSAVGDTSVVSLIAELDGSTVACEQNVDPGTTYLTLPTDTGEYTVEPYANGCGGLCTTITGAATYNSYPTCGAASCSSGYTLSGSGATGTCVSNGTQGGGIISGGGGGGYTPPTTTTYSNGSLLRASGADKVYLIDSGKKRWIPTAEIFSTNGYSWSSIKVVEASVLSQYSDGTNVQIATTPSTPAETSSIPEGGLIRASGDVDVYIVKYVGAKKFKRLILSPSVFNSYKHLKWSDIKDVDKSVIDSFTTSDLVRAVNDSKVYKLYPAGDTGEKRWIETAAAFTTLGYDWDAIYEINQVDRDSYTTGQSLK